MPFGIRPSNVRVCHSTTRADEEWLLNGELLMVGGKRFVRAALLPFACRCLRNGSPNRAKTKITHKRKLAVKSAQSTSTFTPREPGCERVRLGQNGSPYPHAR